MKSINAQIIVNILFCFSLFFTACKKQDDFLDVIPNTSLKVPSTLSDLELMLMSEGLFNASDPGYGVIYAEKTFVTDAYYGSLASQFQAAYTWAKDMQLNQTFDLPDWSYPYKQVLTANIVLDALDKMKLSSAADKTQANVLRGTALFFRSWSFFNIAKEFTQPYDSVTAESQLGIPIRLSISGEEKSVRSNLKETYDRIISDFKVAGTLLPLQSANLALPTTLAVKGALARIYLSLGKYKDALALTNEFLQQFSTVTDYNTLAPSARAIDSKTTLPSEVAFYASIFGYGLTIGGASQVQPDSAFIASYDDNDLRKTLFFNYNPSTGRTSFRGSYDVLALKLFDGIATDEMLLTRAECNARFGNNQAALDDLNKMLRLRYKPGKFLDYTISNTTDVLTLVLKEREKELFMRGLRWNDLRRLNKEAGRAVTLQRKVNGVTYTLPPNDPRYTLQIPDNEILLSGIQQNPR